MAFDEVLFPLKAAYGASGGPTFQTEIVTIDGGYERRNQVWSQARRKFDASSGVKSANDAAIVLAFFQARAGRARGFRLKDWRDYTSAADGVSASAMNDQLIGTGDGTMTAFQLVKNYTSGGVTHRRLIRKPCAGSVLISLDGVAAGSGWSVDTTTGLVTFSTAPSSGVVIGAGFTFDVPVRFDTDHLSLVAEDKQLVQTEIPLIEVRV